MKKVLLWLWQLPQNYIGLLLSIKTEPFNDYILDTGEHVSVYFKNSFFGSGVSLGDYIILDRLYKQYPWSLDKTIKHEHGHQKQSMYLGPLYLIVIGIPSVLGNIYSRLFHKDSEWYYKQPWEAWADKLGGVVR